MAPSCCKHQSFAERCPLLIRTRARVRLRRPETSSWTGATKANLGCSQQDRVLWIVCPGARRFLCGRCTQSKTAASTEAELGRGNKLCLLLIARIVRARCWSAAAADQRTWPFQSKGILLACPLAGYSVHVRRTLDDAIRGHLRELCSGLQVIIGSKVWHALAHTHLGGIVPFVCGACPFVCGACNILLGCGWRRCWRCWGIGACCCIGWLTAWHLIVCHGG